jgi:hypothetical protein
VSAFGETSIAQHLPYIQATALYNRIPDNFREYSSGTGSTGASNNMFTVQTGTGVGGYGAIQSFRSINYKPGQGALARFTALFTAGVASSWQGVGLVNVGDELSFGYSGTSFGIWHRHDGLAEVRTLTVTVGAGGSETLTLTLNTVEYSIPLTSGSTSHNAYEIATWLNANQSVWAADNVGSTVILSALSDSPKSGTYTYSSTGTSTGSIAQTTAGVTKTSEFIPQTSWNGTAVSSLFDPTKGNVYQIAYQYLGFGNIFFCIENPATGQFERVHTITYASAHTTPSLSNPSLKLGMYAVSTGSTTNLTVKSASMAAFTQGVREQTRNPRSAVQTQSVTTSFTNVLTIRNRRTYNGFINQVDVYPLALSLASEGTKNVEVQIRSFQVGGTEQTWSATGTGLVTDIDTTATTGIASGTLLATAVIPSSGSIRIDLDALNITLSPSTCLAIVARTVSGAAINVSAGLTWLEEV